MWVLLEGTLTHPDTHRVRGRSSLFQEKRHQDVAEPLGKRKWGCAGVLITGRNTCRFQYFAKTTVTAAKEAKINTSGYCPEEELFAYKLFGHPRISIGQIFSMHTPLHIFFEIKSTNIQWLFSVKVSFFPLLTVLSLKLSITRSRPSSLGFPGFFSLTSYFFSYAKRNFSHSLLAHEVVHSCIF